MTTTGEQAGADYYKAQEVAGRGEDKMATASTRFLNYNFASYCHNSSHTTAECYFAACSRVGLLNWNIFNLKEKYFQEKDEKVAKNLPMKAPVSLSWIYVTPDNSLKAMAAATLEIDILFGQRF